MQLTGAARQAGGTYGCRRCFVPDIEPIRLRVTNSLKFSTTVSVHGRLVDTRSGLTLWEGSGAAYEDSDNGIGVRSKKGFPENILDDIFSDLVSAAVERRAWPSEDAHTLCDDANRGIVFQTPVTASFMPVSSKLRG